MLRELFSKELVNFAEMYSVIGRFRFTHKLLGVQCDYSAAREGSKDAHIYRLQAENNPGLRDRQNTSIFKVTSSCSKHFVKTAQLCIQHDVGEAVESVLFSPVGIGNKYNVIISYPCKASLSLGEAASCQSLQTRSYLQSLQLPIFKVSFIILKSNPVPGEVTDFTIPKE